MGRVGYAIGDKVKHKLNAAMFMIIEFEGDESSYFTGRAMDMSIHRIRFEEVEKFEEPPKVGGQYL